MTRSRSLSPPPVHARRAAVALVLAGAVGLGLSAPVAWAREVMLSAHLGGIASGQLFEAAAAASRGWQTPGGTVEAQELTAEVDEAVMGGVRAALPLSSWLSVQASASATRLDVTAHALSAATQNVTFYDYDQMTTLIFDLVLVGRLVATPSHPYVVGGAGYSVLSFENSDALDQSRPGLTLGAGYRWAIDPSFALELDVRDQLLWVDTDDEPNRTAVSSFDGAAPLHLWQFTVGACIKL